MAKSATTAEAHRSLLPWVVAGALALIYVLGWLLDVGAKRSPQSPGVCPFLLLLMLLHQVAWPLLVGGVIFGAGAAAGAFLLRLTGVMPTRPAAGLLYATAVGVAVPAYAVLALGSLGMLQAGVFWALAAVMLLVGWRYLWPLLSGAAREAKRWTQSWGQFEWALALAGAALLAVGIACVNTPVLDYDTLEYHLGAPADYLSAGRVHFLSHNVFGNFPAHVEMLSLLGIILGGGKDSGMAVAIVNQLLFAVLAAAAAGLIAGRFVRKDAALPASVFFLSCPLLVVTLARAHVTLALCCYTGLALLALLEWTHGEGDRRDRRTWLVLGGLCCGLAVAVKYSALLLLCLPLGAVLLAVSLGRPGTPTAKLRAPLAFAGFALLALLPWVLRNFVVTGDPVFPLLYGLFGAHGWPAEQAAKFAQAHAVPPVWPPGKPLIDVWRFLIGYVDEMSAGFAGPLVVVFIPFLFALPGRGGREERRAGAPRPAPLVLLAGYCLMAALLWAVATHRIARFLTPMLVALAALSAAGFCVAQHWRPARAVCRGAALLLVFYAIYNHAAFADLTGGLTATLGGGGLKRIARARRLQMLDAYVGAVEWINDTRNVPPGSKVMLVGEARVYYFDRPLLYSTVFNDHPIEPALRLAQRDMEQAVGQLRSSEATHVLVNWKEIYRLRNYKYIYEGRSRPGYLPELDVETRQPLVGLLRASGVRVWADGNMPWPPHDPQERIPVIEIYDVRPGVRGHYPPLLGNRRGPRERDDPRS